MVLAANAGLLAVNVTPFVFVSQVEFDCTYATGRSVSAARLGPGQNTLDEPSGRCSIC